MPCDFASTTMLVVLDGATQVWAALQSLDGGQPPHVPLQPSSPHVLPVHLGVQLADVPPPDALPAEPPAALPPDEAPDDPLVEPPLEETPACPPVATSPPPVAPAPPAETAPLAPAPFMPPLVVCLPPAPRPPEPPAVGEPLLQPKTEHKRNAKMAKEVLT